MKRTAAIALVVLAAASFSACSRAAKSSAAGGPALSFERVVVLGASVSAGIGSGTPVAKVLAAALGERGKVVLDAAEVATYLDVFTIAAEQVDRAIAAKPTVVVAIDILFWYVHNKHFTDEQRSANLEAGLRTLDKLAGTPLFVGDIPDMTGAEKWVLSPRAIPSAEMQATLNARIRDWARDKPWVHVLPLSEWTRALRGNAEIDLGGGRKVAARTLLSPDGLHTNEQGMRWMLYSIEAEIVRAFPGTSANVLQIPSIELSAP